MLAQCSRANSLDGAVLPALVDLRVGTITGLLDRYKSGVLGAEKGTDFSS
jgi:hypothetical protein